MITVKVEYMEPFIKAACSVLEEVSSSEARSGNLSLRGTTFTTATTNIAARIDGSLTGDVIYSMSAATARRLVETIMGMEVSSFGKVMGTGLGSLGTMLAGRTDQVLIEHGHKCQIGSPMVFQGLNVEFAVLEPALAVPIQTDAGEVYVSVAVSNDQQS